MTLSNVVFDIGGVLVDWKPHLAWAHDYGTPEEVEAFMERVEFKARNLRGDGGETFAEMAREIEDARDSAFLAEYPQRYTRTVQDAVPGTWALVDRLKEGGVPVHGITNWSAETWPEGLKVHPRLGEIFETLVVSGREKMLKPNAEIFELFCTRAGVAAETCVFIDDGLHNVDGAMAIGMDGIHFTGADALEQALKDRGLL